ncbi:MAG: hypothetical protein HPZ86_05060 [Clostridia bacterium]|nr:hypothetical protein [Clostridia bacterium]
MAFENNETEEEKKLREEKARAKIAAEVTADFERRREERRSIESGWLLNMNFLSGNQYCDVSPQGGIAEEDKRFYWQSRRVFNHIAPTIDTRIAKLTKMRPALHVRAFSDEEGDVKAAKLASGVLDYVGRRIGLDEVVANATLWSETCGSAFYKVVWDERGGRQVAVDAQGLPVYEGEADVAAVSPFEIFPDSLGAESLAEVKSLIHARVVPVEYIAEKFGVVLKGREIIGPVAAGYSEPSGAKNPVLQAGGSRLPTENGEILIERYTRPNAEEKDGRLEIVAGGKLLYLGVLPYLSGERGERGFPFVKQDCIRLPGAFFASSIIDRLIPVQRAYNAVRNRKHEFLNRLSMGVLTVEDGSVDIDELTEEGLSPGKVLVYRQGGKPPEMLDCGDVPAQFEEEETRLEKEFVLISGVSDLSQNSTPARVTSASGLQLLLSQDDSRLAATTDNISRAVKETGRQILRLYKQFAGSARLLTLTGENKKTQVYYFNAAELSANDIVFESEDAVTPEQKRETLMKLFEAGLLTDEDGKLSEENKNRILEAFGFGSYENAKNVSALHITKADEENLTMKSGAVEPDDYDDHELHIARHVRFLLSEEFRRLSDASLKKRCSEHIEAHRRLAKKAERKTQSGEEESSRG